MPITRVPGSTVPTTPSTQPTTPAAPAAPTTPAAPATPASTPSRFDATVARAKGKVVELAMDAVADERTLSQGANFGLVSGNVKIAEKIALSGTDTFRELVAGDSRRSAHAQQNPDAVWVATRAMAGTSAAVPLGAGAALGFSGSAEVTSIVAHDVSGARDVAGAIKAQAKSLYLPLDAEGLQSMKAAPGTEWMFRGQVGASAGIGAGVSSSAGTGIFAVNANAGVNVGVNSSDVFTKHVKVLEGNKVFVQVGEVEQRGASASLGASVAVDLDTSGTVANRAAREVEKRTRFEATLSGNTSRSEKVLGAAVLDLATPAGRAAYDHLIKAGPREAADYIKQQGLGVNFNGTNRTTATGVSFNIGGANLLSTSTVRGTSTGAIEEPGSTTLLAQTDYGRNVGGFFARLTVGEERSVAVRAGAVTKGGVTEQAVAVSLSVKDPKLTGAERNQLERFATAMGSPLAGLPAAPANGDDLGKAEYQVSVALTGGDVAQLRQWGKEEISLAFANAHREISGDAQLPPWFDQKATFDWYKGQLHDAQFGSDPQQRQNVERDYKDQFGRDLSKDIDSAEAIERISTQVLKSRGKPVEEWGKMLESLGKQQSSDVRAAALALKRLAGADVVSLSVTVGGKTVAAQAQGSAPKTIDEITGPLLNPPS